MWNKALLTTLFTLCLYSGPANAGQITDRVDFLIKNSNWLTCYQVDKLDCSNLASTFVNIGVGNLKYQVVAGRMAKMNNVWHTILVIEEDGKDIILDTTNLQIYEDFSIFDLMLFFPDIEIAKLNSVKGDFDPAVITYSGKTKRFTLSPWIEN